MRIWDTTNRKALSKPACTSLQGRNIVGWVEYGDIFVVLSKEAEIKVGFGIKDEPILFIFNRSLIGKLHNIDLRSIKSLSQEI